MQIPLCLRMGSRGSHDQALTMEPSMINLSARPTPCAATRHHDEHDRNDFRQRRHPRRHQPARSGSPGIFVIWDGMGIVAKRIEHVPHSESPKIVIKSINPEYQTYERDGEEVNIVGRVIWAA